MIGLKSLKRVAKPGRETGLFIKKEPVVEAQKVDKEDVIEVVGEVMQEVAADASSTVQSSVQMDHAEEVQAPSDVVSVEHADAAAPPKAKKSFKGLFSRKKASDSVTVEELTSKQTSSSDDAPAAVQPQHPHLDDNLGEDAPVRLPPAAEEKPSLKQRLKARKAAPREAVAAFSERPVELPVQILMGYLPEVTSKDAMDYALGMAEKYLTQVGMAFFYVTKHDRGFIWEVHEGGPGKAYGPEISTVFGTNRMGIAGSTPMKVILDTATRKVEVTQGTEGLSAVLLPQNSMELATTSLIPRQNMTPAIPRRKGLLITGALVLASGVLVSTLAGYFFRVQEFAAAPARTIVNVNAKLLPHLYWKDAVLSLRPEDRVRAMRYDKGSWLPLDLYPRAAPAASVTTSPVSGSEGQASATPPAPGSTSPDSTASTNANN